MMLPTVQFHPASGIPCLGAEGVGFASSLLLMLFQCSFILLTFSTTPPSPPKKKFSLENVITFPKFVVLDHV